MMRRLLLAVIFAAGALAVPARGSAQVTQSDSAAVLLGVATRLRAEGRNALANSLLDLIVERYGNTPSAAEARTLRAQQSRVQEEGSGKTELLVWSTTYGLALGVLTPVAFGVDDKEVYGLGLIAGGPAGFLIGRSILKQRPVSEGQARAISFGTLWGAWQGYAIAEILDLDDRDHTCDFDVCYSDENGEVLLRASLLGSVAGLAGGLYLSRKPIPAGTATAVNFGAFWGTWYGAVVDILLGDEEDFESDRGITLAALGGNAGLLFTALTAPRMQLSVARARLISITGVAGLLAGFGILLVANPDDISNEAILVPALTSALGLGLGAYWTRDYDERSRGGGQGGDSGDALLERRGDSWKLGIPEPGIRALEIRRNGRPAFAPGLSVSLFKARF